MSGTLNVNYVQADVGTNLNLNSGGAVGSVIVANNGSITSTTNGGLLAVGNTLNYTDTGIIASFASNTAGYGYVVVQNQSASNTAYSSYAVYNNSGNYMEIGVNSSNYSYLAAGYPNNNLQLANAGFIYAANDMVVGTWGANSIHFVTNGSTSTTDAMTISSTGVTTFSADITVHGIAVGQGGGSVPTNTVVGASALANNTSGTNNTAVGYQALNLNTASNNTAVGYQAGYSNTTGAHNIVMGYQAGYTNTVGGYNIFIGDQAGYTSNVALGNNTCVGPAAGYGLTTGTINTFIGANSTVGAAGYYVTTGSKNTIIGGFNGNQYSCNITASNNNLVLSDGDGFPYIWGSKDTSVPNNRFLQVGTYTAVGNARFAFYPNGSIATYTNSFTLPSNYGLFEVNITAVRNVSGSYCTFQGRWLFSGLDGYPYTAFSSNYTSIATVNQSLTSGAFPTVTITSTAPNGVVNFSVSNNVLAVVVVIRLAADAAAF